MSEKWNIADVFTIYRILTAPVLLFLLYFDHRNWFSWVLLSGFLSDAIDGYLARKFKISTIHGARLDSAADALVFIIGVTGVVVFETDFIIENCYWIIGAFLIYLAQLIYGIIRYGKPSSLHTYSAKLSAIIQAACLLTFLFLGANYWLFYATLFISVYETIEEMILIYLLPEWQTNVKGVYWVLRERKKR